MELNILRIKKYTYFEANKFNAQGNKIEAYLSVEIEEAKTAKINLREKQKRIEIKTKKKN